MKKLSVKDWISKIISESENHSDDNIISSNDIESVTNANINPTKGTLTISFKHNDGREMKLKVKDKLFYDWTKKDKSEEESDLITNFLYSFLSNSKHVKDKMISEIVDDYNNLIGDDDLPKDIDNRMIGLSSVDSDTAVYQMRAKPMGNYASWGLGFVTW